ncbi:hypothetical protein CEXT_374831 [Caerostris extrusa]|uniref:Uncharacterized protein n=1 Tax=Caerostris extrusa TaxID=172846 RepID=A0AAV4NCP7_CAEEX|nr:hypothetical protein CEXT_374831 [Caerostris extrusa]
MVPSSSNTLRKKKFFVSQKLQRTLNVPANTSPFSRRRDKPWLMANCRFHWDISSGSYLSHLQFLLLTRQVHCELLA